MTRHQRVRRQARRAHDAARGSGRRGERPWPSDRQKVERDQRRELRRAIDDTAEEVRMGELLAKPKPEPHKLMPSEIKIREHKRTGPTPMQLGKDRIVRERKERDEREEARLLR